METNRKPTPNVTKNVTRRRRSVARLHCLHAAAHTATPGMGLWHQITKRSEGGSCSPVQTSPARPLEDRFSLTVAAKGKQSRFA